jgi:hypothetical protein
MSRSWIVLVTLASGCSSAISLDARGIGLEWGGSTVHRPAIAAELDSLYKPSRASWQPDPAVVERGILQSMGTEAPRDDSPFWRGPAHTAFASGTAEQPDASSAKELAVRRKEYEERVQAHQDELRARENAPRPGDVDRALSAWDEWKTEHGYAPIDISPAPPPEPPDKKGP